MTEAPFPVVHTGLFVGSVIVIDWPSALSALDAAIKTKASKAARVPVRNDHRSCSFWKGSLENCWEIGNSGLAWVR